MASPNPNCSITNGTSTDVMVIDASSASDTNESQAQPPGNMAFERELSLPLISDGSHSIPAGATKTVKLEAVYKDPDGINRDRTNYELIAAASHNLFPIKNLFELVDTASNTYPPITLAESDINKMNLAFQFYQFILALPTSILAQGFYDALIEATSATSIAEIDTIMSTYFQSTVIYQTLDLNICAAIWTYYEMYACAAASNLSSFTYYLYTHSTREENAAANESLSRIVAPHPVGTLVLNRTSTEELAKLTDHNSAYTITYSGMDSTGGTTITVSLYYQRGQFTSGQPADPSSGVFIQPSFALQSLWTNQSTDNQLIPVCYGSVYGKPIIGLTLPQTDPNAAWYALWNRITLKKWMKFFHTFIDLDFIVTRLLKAVVFSYGQLSGLVSRSKGQPLSQAVMDSVKRNVQYILAKIPQGIENLDTFVTQLRAALAYQFVVQESQIQMDIFLSQAKQLKALATDSGTANANTPDGEPPLVDTTLQHETSCIIADAVTSLGNPIIKYVINAYDTQITTICSQDIQTAKDNLKTAIQNQDPNLPQYVQALIAAEQACLALQEPNMQALTAAVEANRTTIANLNTNLAQIATNYKDILSSGTQQTISDTNAEIADSENEETQVQQSGAAMSNGEIDPTITPYTVDFLSVAQTFQSTK